jgi:hypothetical protein
MTLRSRQAAALEPVRAALLSQASQQAAMTVSLATDTAAALLARARQDADDAVAIAAADGAAEAKLVATAVLTRARRNARSVSLRADAATRQYLVRRIRSAVLALRDQADYPLLRDRLIELAGNVAGPDAVVTEHADGGVIARVPGIVVDCSLGRLADQAIANLETQIAACCARSQPPAGNQDGEREDSR